MVALVVMGLFCVTAFAQQKALTGTVTDEAGEPLAGVTVQIKGTNNYAVTDVNGGFSLQGVKENAVVGFTLIGFKPQDIAVKGDKMTVKMVEDVESLDDVVVIGYGQVKRRDLTGAVSSVRADDIVKMPTHNVMDAIQGQVPGLDITKTDGQAGSGVNITLRGNRSINGSNTPLFIIDGMEGSYADLNPSDIASIEILKDASSTAIYGASGANGVVIITTKNPKAGKFNATLDAYYGWNTINKFPEVNSGEDYINFRREAQKTAGNWSSSADDANLFPEDIKKYVDANKWVNWFKEASQTGKTTDINLSTSYANEKVSAFFSLNYYDLQGIAIGDELKRYSSRAKVEFTPNKVLSYGINLYAMYSDNNKRSDRIWNRVLNMVPVGDIYDENGNLNNFPVNGNTTYINPIVDQDASRYVNQTKTLSLTPQAFVEIKPIKGLSFKSVFGAYLSNAKTGFYAGATSYQGLEYGATSQYAETPNTFTYNYKWDNILTYNLDINDAHHLTFTAVSEWSKNQRETSNARAYGFSSDSYLYHNLGAGSETPTVSSSYVGNQRMSYVARINYNLLDRYLFTISSRWDGSSMLAEGKKWDVFPAGAFAWHISNEDFMANARAISDMKLRVSYGVTGNAGASEYATLDYSRTGQIGFQDVSEMYSGFSQNIANLELGWEKSYTWDVGLDMSFFKDRLSFTFDWYRTDTKDILYQKSLPAALGGYASSAFKMWANVGETLNQGVELSITSRNFVRKNFSWTTTLGFAKNNEEVVKTTSDGPLQFGDYYLIPGQPIHTYYGYKYAGIWGTAEAEEAAKYGQKPGQVHIAEQPDADGNINYKLSSDDYYVLGNADPKWTGSLYNGFNFYNFDFSFLMLARWGQTIYYGLTGWYRLDGLSPSPTICDYWTESNQSARYPQPNANSSQDAYQQWCNYFDGSYVKIKNITLGYSLPQSIAQKIKMERARIYVTASDPFIFTKSKYLSSYDPEKGGDDDTTPLTKQFVIGLNLTF